MRNYENQMAAKFARNAEWANYGNDGYDRAASGRWAAWMDAAKALEAGEAQADVRARMVAKTDKHDGIAKGYGIGEYNAFDHGFARGAEDVVKALDEAAAQAGARA